MQGSVRECDRGNATAVPNRRQADHRAADGTVEALRNTLELAGKRRRSGIDEAANHTE
jgi:hypothetical protein